MIASHDVGGCLLRLPEHMRHALALHHRRAQLGEASGEGLRPIHGGQQGGDGQASVRACQPSQLLNSMYAAMCVAAATATGGLYLPADGGRVVQVQAGNELAGGQHRPLGQLEVHLACSGEGGWQVEGMVRRLIRVPLVQQPSNCCVLVSGYPTTGVCSPAAGASSVIIIFITSISA